jgi:hypothetical protein
MPSGNGWDDHTEHQLQPPTDPGRAPVEPQPPSRSRRPAGSMPLLRGHQRGPANRRHRPHTGMDLRPLRHRLGVPHTAALLRDLGAVAQEIRRLRWVLGQVIALADAAPKITNEQLRDPDC